MGSLCEFKNFADTLEKLGFPTGDFEGVSTDFRKAIVDNKIEFDNNSIIFDDHGVKRKGYVYKLNYYVNYKIPPKFPKFHITKCETIQEFIESGKFGDMYIWSNKETCDVYDLDTRITYHNKKLELCEYCRKKLGLPTFDTKEFYDILVKESEQSKPTNRTFQLPVSGSESKKQLEEERRKFEEERREFEEERHKFEEERRKGAVAEQEAKQAKEEVERAKREVERAKREAKQAKEEAKEEAEQKAEIANKKAKQTKLEAEHAKQKAEQAERDAKEQRDRAERAEKRFSVISRASELDGLLKRKGFEGDGLMGRLKSAEYKLQSSIFNNAREAIKIRNKMTHEQYNPTENEINKTISAFRQAIAAIEKPDPPKIPTAPNTPRTYINTPSGIRIAKKGDKK
jgi:hypothetical protein